MVAYRVDALGRVVIPVQIRQQLGIEPGTPMVCSIEGGAVVLRPMGKTTYTKSEVVDLVAGALQSAGYRVRREAIEAQLDEQALQMDAAAVAAAVREQTRAARK
jgi:AbrB family transcriptional regulator, transcriptional pleiotropic regulator of transition state genes